jgi:1,4-dihydroxy-2-naphthoate polyprenyltransferase
MLKYLVVVICPVEKPKASLSTKLMLWIRLGRLHFLIPAALTYAYGGILAVANGGVFELQPFLLAYSILLFAQLSMHLSNDYYDRESDKTSHRTILSGGSGVLAEHPLMATPTKWMAIILLIASVVTAIVLVYHFSFPSYLIIFAGLGALLGWFYTAPPLKLAYRGLGETSTALAAGLIIPGLGYLVVSGTIDLWFIAFSVPLICYGLLFIITVEMPDVDSDRETGKLSMLVRFGMKTGARIAFLATIVATTFMSVIAYSDVLSTTIDLWTMAWFSVVPLVMAGLGAFRDLSQKRQVISQVWLNAVGIVSIGLIYFAVAVLTFW